MRFPILALAAATLTLGACGKPAATEENISVADARVRLPVVPGRPGAAYFTLSAMGTAVTLERVTSPQVERIELHTTPPWWQPPFPVT